MKHPFGLIILDGFGYKAQQLYNAPAQAHTPTLDYLKKQYAYTHIHASGKHVGLPEGTPGNSEVGHLTIGSGKIIPHTLTKFMQDVTDKNSFALRRILQACAVSKTQNLHLIGLVSNGNVHSSLQGVSHLIHTLLTKTTHQIYLHAITDGRDTPPQSAQSFLDDLTKKYASKRFTIASIHGRWYAMDRDNNQERIQKSWDILTHQSNHNISYQDYIDLQYSNNITDEFFIPTALKNHTAITSQDTVICFNIRADRMRQLAQKLCDHTPDVLSPIQYSPTLPTQVFLKPQPQTKSLLEKVTDLHIPIITAAESEKYAHITYFLNGGKETKLATEKRYIIPSKACTSYAKHPTMSATEITNVVLSQLEKQPSSFCVVNYANADMVGHTGNLQATITAIEHLDVQIKRLYTFIKKYNGSLLITSDHGNSEVMFDTISQQPCTSHTNSLVPLYFVTPTKQMIPKKVQGLADLAPWILEYISQH